MIKIEITRVVYVPYKEDVRYCVHEEPTEIVEDSESYGSRKREVQFKRDFETKQVDRVRNEKVTLLVQEISNDDDFDLNAVIAAINGLV